MTQKMRLISTGLAAGTVLSLAMSTPPFADGNRVGPAIILAQAERTNDPAMAEQPPAATNQELKDLLNKKKAAGDGQKAAAPEGNAGQVGNQPAAAEPPAAAPQPSNNAPKVAAPGSGNKPEPLAPIAPAAPKVEPQPAPQPKIVEQPPQGPGKDDLRQILRGQKKKKDQPVKRAQPTNDTTKAIAPPVPAPAPKVATPPAAKPKDTGETVSGGPKEAAPLTDSGKEALRNKLRNKNRNGFAGGGEVASPIAKVPPPDGAVANPIAKSPPPGATVENPMVRFDPPGNGEVVSPIAKVPPPDDAAAQKDLTVDFIESVRKEKGKRIRGERRNKRPRDDGRIIDRRGGRLIIQLDDGGLSVTMEDDHDRRLQRRAQEVYVEELRGGRTRETIIRRNGVRIVTIYNQYGDVIRRSRIDPDGRETILVYVPRDRWDEVRDPGYDAGANLPPLRLNIPRDEYILEAERADRDDYYRFLNRAPVEQVERLYSVDEVRHSARIRDKVRRVDMDTITFETGSADIPESEVDELQNLGDAIIRMLEDSPGETFLIEGHTDAVGSDEYNLVLSDQRAESVAEILTDFFKIPPENLVTQGYGERYLKINTPYAERENRRVAVRRITALVTPVNQRVSNQ